MLLLIDCLPSLDIDFLAIPISCPHNYYNKNIRKVRCLMKIVVAPDAFKESMTAYEAAVAMEKGVKKVVPNADITKVPIADGGEGTVQALLDALDGEKVYTTITGPLGGSVESFYGIVDKELAVIEIAAACGLDLIPKSERNPMHTTSYGVGELIIDALDRGIRRFLIGLGGSGTNDGGIGMAQALGVNITDKVGKDVPPGGLGLEAVQQISTARLDPRLAACEIKVASDVSNRLLGQQGASYMYGPQKGANPDMVERLDQAMIHYATVIEKNLHIKIADQEGAGAAGGLGAACLAFLDAQVESGIDLIAQRTGLAESMKDADLVLTGEGKMDAQTSFGKAIAGVAKLATRYEVPVIAITGANQTDETIYEHGVDAVFSLPNEPMTLNMAMHHGATLTEKVTENILRLIVSMP